MDELLDRGVQNGETSTGFAFCVCVCVCVCVFSS